MIWDGDGMLRPAKKSARVGTSLIGALQTRAKFNAEFLNTALLNSSWNKLDRAGSVKSDAQKMMFSPFEYF
jgi:hypothetical protein